MGVVLWSSRLSRDSLYRSLYLVYRKAVSLSFVGGGRTEVCDGLVCSQIFLSINDESEREREREIEERFASSTRVEVFCRNRTDVGKCS